MAQALEGIRILDLSWGVAGPLGVLLLAEHGADVIKVEPPGGDPFRRYPGYKVWTRSRRSVVCDLARPAGKDAFTRLARAADVVVESFRPGVMERFGIGAAILAEANPRLIYCAVPGYPRGHPFADRPGYDALVQAASGQQWEQPGWRPGPIFLHMPMPSMGALYLVASGVLAALHARERTGRGQRVDTSLLQGAFLYTTQIWQDVEHADESFHAVMAKTDPPSIHQPLIYECANDEYLHLSVMSGQTPTRSQEEITGAPQSPLPVDMLDWTDEQRAELAARQRVAYTRHDRDTLVAALQAANYAVEAIVPAHEQFARPHPQLAANRMVATVEDPDLGPTTQMGVPIHLLGTPGEIRGPQPRVGEHDVDIWGDELGHSDDEIAAITGGG
jgi:crotonobetainyl-CoA:carnitine CoA-transferase CaiB-like acyl-CoA transferase